MPCDLGYRQVAPIRIPQPAPQEFKVKVKPPEIDADLLEKIGEDDPDFVEQVGRIDTQSLIELALKNTKEAVTGSDQVTIRVNAAGQLEITSTFTNANQKKVLEELIQKITARFQIEVLAVVAQVLDYEIKVSSQKKGAETILTLEGEKHGQ